MWSNESTWEYNVRMCGGGCKLITLLIGRWMVGCMGAAGCWAPKVIMNDVQQKKQGKNTVGGKLKIRHSAHQTLKIQVTTLGVQFCTIFSTTTATRCFVTFVVLGALLVFEQITGCISGVYVKKPIKWAKWSEKVFIRNTYPPTWATR